MIQVKDENQKPVKWRARTRTRRSIRASASEKSPARQGAAQVSCAMTRRGAVRPCSSFAGQSEPER